MSLLSIATTNILLQKRITVLFSLAIVIILKIVGGTIENVTSFVIIEQRIRPDVLLLQQQQRHVSFVTTEDNYVDNYIIRSNSRSICSRRRTSKSSCLYFTAGSNNNIKSLEIKNKQRQGVVLNNAAVSTSSSTSVTTTNNNNTQSIPGCFYKNAATRNRWKQRIEINDLYIGQQLDGVIVQEYLNGTTGPKLYIDCGIGWYNHRTNKWSIQNAMLRLFTNKLVSSVTNVTKTYRKTIKESVIRKKVNQLRTKKEYVTAYVSRVLPNQVEVVLNIEDIPSDGDDNLAVDGKRNKAFLQKKKYIPAGTLQIGQQVNGTVVKVTDYGAFVDVNANRLGLLHIKQVAKLYSKYIDKTSGLINAGLEVGSRIKVQVLSNQQKRLFLDFTDDVKEFAAEQQQQKQEPKHPQQKVMENSVATMSAGTTTATVVASATTTPTSKTDVITSINEDEIAAAAAAAAEHYKKQSRQEDDEKDSDSEEEYDDDDDSEYDDYDEQRDIEDQLGLGSY